MNAFELQASQFPHNLPQHSQQHFGVVRFRVQSPHQAPQLFLRGGGGARLHISAGAERLKQERRDALDLSGTRRLRRLD